MMLEELLVAVNLGIMWAKRDCPMLLEALSKARALWKKDKKWAGLTVQKCEKSGYLQHQLLVQEQFARTGQAECMKPHLTTPFPRWRHKWEAQLVREGRELFGVVLPGAACIMSNSFACNVWDGVWPVKESDGLARWAEMRQASAPGPGASPRAPGPGASPGAPGPGASPGASSDTTGPGAGPALPTAKMQEVVVILLNSFSALIESGVPVTIALRTLATAIQAIGHGGGPGASPGDEAAAARERARATLPANQAAFGFLSGALKSEWLNSSEIGNLEGSRGALADRFGLSREFAKKGCGIRMLVR